MSQRLTVVTRKGQITIPAEYRRALALEEGDKVAVTLEGGQMRVIPYGSVAARTAGMLRGEEPVLSAEELREAAEEAIVEQALERMRS
jgi:AbrB family looped-hinge helix DNA binding protein